MGPGPSLANLRPHAKLYDEALCFTCIDGRTGWVVLVEPRSGVTTLMAHFHYSAEHGLSVPFLVAFPLGVVPASGYFFTVFLALQIRGSFRANNRAEYAKLVRESLATTTK